MKLNKLHLWAGMHPHEFGQLSDYEQLRRLVDDLQIKVNEIIVALNATVSLPGDQLTSERIGSKQASPKEPSEEPCTACAKNVSPINIKLWKIKKLCPKHDKQLNDYLLGMTEATEEPCICKRDEETGLRMDIICPKHDGATEANEELKLPFQLSCPCGTCSGYCVCGIEGHHPESTEVGAKPNIKNGVNLADTFQSPKPTEGEKQ